MKKKAIVKETGEIHDVVSEYSMQMITINFEFDLPKEMKEKMELEFTNDKVKMKSGKDKEDHYVLSDGKDYESDDIIVGTDEIRNWKIKSGLNI